MRQNGGNAFPTGGKFRRSGRRLARLCGKSVSNQARDSRLEAAMAIRIAFSRPQAVGIAAAAGTRPTTATRLPDDSLERGDPRFRQKRLGLCPAFAAGKTGVKTVAMRKILPELRGKSFPELAASLPPAIRLASLPARIGPVFHYGGLLNSRRHEPVCRVLLSAESAGRVPEFPAIANRVPIAMDSNVR